MIAEGENDPYEHTRVRVKFRHLSKPVVFFRVTARMIHANGMLWKTRLRSLHGVGLSAHAPGCVATLTGISWYFVFVDGLRVWPPPAAVR